MFNNLPGYINILTHEYCELWMSSYCKQTWRQDIQVTQNTKSKFKRKTSAALNGDKNIVQNFYKAPCILPADHGTLIFDKVHGGVTCQKPVLLIS